jgi:serine protease Do
MGGRPSYQTTRGYVSNESFRLDDASRPLVYVQHTAPIDPGSSGGPLTDDKGNVLGVNTLKVTNREAVALAVPAESVLETLRRSDAVESKRGSAPQRRESARLACLGLVGELASKKPRMMLLETMIANTLTGSEGLAAASVIDDEAFGQLWQSDSVRAMRIATLLRVQSVIGAAGGSSALEICGDVNADDARDILSADEVRYRVRLGNWETRELAFRWEQGHWKLARMDLRAPGAGTTVASAPLKPSGARPTSAAASATKAKRPSGGSGR